MSSSLTQLDAKNSIVKNVFKTIRRFWRTSPLAFMGGTLLVLLILMAVFSPVLAPESHTATDYKQIRNPPSLDRPLGSDHLGRDALSRIIIGSRTSLFIAFSAVFIAKFIGVSWGIISGYSGGKVDIISQRFTEILEAIPSVIFALLLLAAIGAGVFGVIVAITIGGIAGTTRVIRSVVLSVKEMEFVTAAHALGASPMLSLIHI